MNVTSRHIVGIVFKNRSNVRPVLIQAVYEKRIAEDAHRWPCSEELKTKIVINITWNSGSGVALKSGK